jgi:hypothetical protein
VSFQARITSLRVIVDALPRDDGRRIAARQALADADGHLRLLERALGRAQLALADTTDQPANGRIRL